MQSFFEPSTKDTNHQVLKSSFVRFFARGVATKVVRIGQRECIRINEKFSNCLSDIERRGSLIEIYLERISYK